MAEAFNAVETSIYLEDPVSRPGYFVLGANVWPWKTFRPEREYQASDQALTAWTIRTGNTLRWQATVEDPEHLMAPWTMNPIIRALDARPNAFVAEDLPCEERDREHLVSKVRSG